MLIELKHRAPKVLSTRTDEESYYSLVALANKVGSDQSTLLRLATSRILLAGRKLNPSTLAQLMEAQW